MSIHDLTQKIKSLIAGDDWRDIVIISIVILVGIGSFFLGRWSKIPIKTIDKVVDSIDEEIPQKTDIGNFVASKNGTKYYSFDCSGIDRIKEENKIYFATEEEAKAGGRSKSSICK